MRTVHLTFVAASLLSMSAAYAAPICLGTDGTIIVCVDPSHALDRDIPPVDCVYLGLGPCTPIQVPFPSNGVLTIDCSNDGDPECTP